MRYYEIVFLTYPNQNTKIQIILNIIKKLIKEKSGKVNRLENWGSRYLAYPVKKTNRANYVLINISCDIIIIKKIKSLFLSQKTIIRFLILNIKKIITNKSKFMLQNKLI